MLIKQYNEVFKTSWNEIFEIMEFLRDCLEGDEVPTVAIAIGFITGTSTPAFTLPPQGGDMVPYDAQSDSAKGFDFD